MIKKIFLVLLIFILSACNLAKEEKQYIEPMNNVFLFDEIDEESKTKLKQANGDKEYENYQFKMISKDIYDEDLTDINGNTINLKNYDCLVFEIVSVGCSHCKKMIAKDLKIMLNKDVTFVQYFNVGDKDDILDLYKDIGIEIPDNLIIIEYNESLYDYVKDYLKIESYPTLVLFKNGKVSINSYGQLDTDGIDTLYDLGFNNPITIEENVINLDRSIDDVRESLSEENLDKLKQLDNDKKTEEYTLRLIGSKVDFNNITRSKSNVYVNEVDDYSNYLEEDLIVIYTYLQIDNDINNIEFINSLIDSNKGVSYLVVLVEGVESSSAHYLNSDVKFKCPVTSILGYIPDDLYKMGVKNYPTAFFIEKGTYVGAYSNINSIGNFNEAIDMFFGDDSISLVNNN